MSKQTNSQRLAWEKAAFAYSTALENGDFEMVTAVLAQAEQDPILAQMLLEINEAQQEEMEASMVLNEAEMVEDDNGRQLQTNSQQSWRRYIRPILVGVSLIVIAWLCLFTFQVFEAYSNLNNNNNLVGFLDLLSPLPQTLPERIAYEFRDLTRGTNNDMAIVEPIQIQMDALAAEEVDNVVLPDSAFSNRANEQVVERLIIRNGSITVVVEDPTEVRQQIQDLVADMAGEGAFVVSSQEFGGANDLPKIHMIIRVPATEFEATMAWLADTAVPGSNPSRSETADDVTEEFVDLSARLESMEAARDRLLEIMQNAETTEELLQAENQLTIREAEIEGIQGRLQYLQQSAALSLIDIYLEPYILNQPLENDWRPAETVRTAYESLIESAQGIVDFLIFSVIAILPWLIVFGLLIYLAYRFIWKRYRSQH